MRTPKPKGNYKPHGADKCGICAKPKRYRKYRRLIEAIRDAMKARRGSYEQ